MIIGIDARSLQDSAPSGVSRYTAGMVEALLKADSSNEYRLFVNAAGGLNPPRPDWHYPNLHWQIGRWPNKLLNTSFRFLGWPKLDKLIGGCDVLWVPNAHFLAVSSTVKLVVTVHDLSFLLQPDLLTLKKRWWHRLVGLPALCRRADKVVAVSETTRRDIIRVFDLSPDRVVNVMPGLSPLPAPADIAELRQRWQLPQQFLFHVATKEPRKNIIAAIQALELLHAQGHRQLGLVCAGGFGWKQSTLQRRINASPVKSQIHLLPYITDAEKHALYRAAAVFVYPSFYEGFGFPPLEALAAGCPVVVGTAGSLPETCGEAAVLVDPHRPNDLAAAVAALISNDDWRAAKVAAGKIWARQFSWALSAQQLSQIFKSICE